MKRALPVLLALSASSAFAGDAIGNIGSLRGDYWTRTGEVELNLVLNAIPFIDVEAGLKLPSSAAHLAIGPRFEVLSRESEGGVTVRIVVLFGGWVNLNGALAFSAVSASPGVEGTYWFSKRFGITASVSVPIFFPYSEGSGISTSAISASPRLGLGFSF